MLTSNVHDDVAGDVDEHLQHGNGVGESFCVSEYAVVLGGVDVADAAARGVRVPVDSHGVRHRDEATHDHVHTDTRSGSPLAVAESLTSSLCASLPAIRASMTY